LAGCSPPRNIDSSLCFALYVVLSLYKLWIKAGFPQKQP
jgi:hypothetical protein